MKARLAFIMCDVEVSESGHGIRSKYDREIELLMVADFQSVAFFISSLRSSRSLTYKANTFLVQKFPRSDQSEKLGTLRAGPINLASCRVAVASRGACSSSAAHFAAASAASSTNNKAKMDIEGASCPYIVSMEAYSACIFRTTTYFIITYPNYALPFLKDELSIKALLTTQTTPQTDNHLNVEHHRPNLRHCG